MKKVIVTVCAVVIALATVFIVRGSGNDGCGRAMAQADQRDVRNPLALTCAQWQALGNCPKPADPRSCREIRATGECPLWIPVETFPTGCAGWQELGMCPVRWTCAQWLALEICPRDVEGVRCSQLIEENRCPVRWTCAPIIEREMCPVFAPGRVRRMQ
ncbi:MAG: hypothetical protein FWC98_02040 [Bacteroidales bacterium]|nr:hypothetical protein [Bacteroidales bacterium]